MDNSTLMTIRRIGALVLAAAAVVVVLTAGPDIPEGGGGTNYARLLDIARSDYDADNARTSGAPQQQVVNGWFARDALSLQILQLSDLLEQTEPPPTDQRIPLLGLFAVLAICLYAATSPTVRRAGVNTDDDTPDDTRDDSGEPGEPGAKGDTAPPEPVTSAAPTSPPGASPPPPAGPPLTPPQPPPPSPPAT